MDDIQEDLKELCDLIESLYAKYGNCFSCISFMEIDTQGSENDVIAKTVNSSVGNYEDFKFIFSNVLKVPVMLIAALDAITDLVHEAYKNEPLIVKISALKALELLKMRVTMDNSEIKKDIEEREAISADVDKFLKNFYKGEALTSSFLIL